LSVISFTVIGLKKTKKKKQIAFLYKRCVEKHSMILVGLSL
jgi:hypothetical protein